MLRILIVGLVVLMLAVMLIPRDRIAIEPLEAATTLPVARVLPDVTLTDYNGEPFAIGDLAGEFALLFFGFTNCPDICPLTLQVLAQAKLEIEARTGGPAPQVVFVSVDPYRDTTDRLRAYVRNFDPSFTGVTASDAELAPLLEQLGVMVHKNEVDGEPYNVVHNGTIYVLDPAARWVGIFGGSSHDASVVARDFLRIRAARGGSNEASLEADADTVQ